MTLAACGGSQEPGSAQGAMSDGSCNPVMLREGATLVSNVAARERKDLAALRRAVVAFQEKYAGVTCWTKDRDGSRISFDADALTNAWLNDIDQALGEE
jgi:hypothetical protein